MRFLLQGLQSPPLLHDTREFNPALLLVVLPTLKQISIAHLFLELVECFVVEVPEIYLQVDARLLCCRRIYDRRVDVNE